MSLTTVRFRKMPKTRPQNNPGLEKNNGKGLRQYSTVSEQARKKKNWNSISYQYLIISALHYCFTRQQKPLILTPQHTTRLQDLPIKTAYHRAVDPHSFFCGSGSSWLSPCGSGSSWFSNADLDPDPAFILFFPDVFPSWTGSRRENLCGSESTALPVCD